VDFLAEERPILLLLAFGLLNILAYRHAYAMTHYVPGGDKTGKPESLSGLERLQVLLTGVTVPRPTARGSSPERIGLPFEVHTVPDEGRITLEAWYIPHPGAQGIVLLFHGYAACKASLLHEARVLHELGYALFLVDFRGSGGSTGQETTIGVREADDVGMAAGYVQEHWGNLPLILYGQSMGAVAVLRAVAYKQVRPQAVIVECPFDRLLATVSNRFRAMGVPAFPCAQLLVFWGGVQQGFNGFRHNPVEYAESVDCPVLFLHGAGDPRVTVEQARTVFSALPAEKEFALFDGTGHESCLAQRPEHWEEVVSQFLSKQIRHDP
jgi:alpha-beta hydrolase superfamily lysophospholipase